MLEFLGLIGSLCFAVNSWPQAWQAYKTKSAQGVALSMLVLSAIGGSCSLFYVVATSQYAIIPNFLCGLLGVFVVLFYKIKEVGKGRQE